MMQMLSDSVMDVLGPPAKTITFPDASITLWSLPPILATQVTGFASAEVADTIDMLVREHVAAHDAIVTFHEWSAVRDYDTPARKILQQLTREVAVASQHRETVVHLGRGDTLVRKITIATAGTITWFRHTPIEIFRDETEFAKRMYVLLGSYCPERTVPATGSSDAPQSQL